MKRPRIHLFQHDPTVGPGYIASWLRQKGFGFSTTRFFMDEPLPQVKQFDWLIILGGSMGVYDYDRYPWLYEEKRRIEQAINQCTIVLGICLGAQLIAEVMGARIFKTRCPEIGWHPVELSKESKATPLLRAVPRKFTTFHWHEDAFDLPDGSIRLGSSRGCLNQGFVFADRVIGLQFHPETLLEDVRIYVEQARHERFNGARECVYVQTSEQILAMEENYNCMHRALGQILENLAGQHHKLAQR